MGKLSVLLTAVAASAALLTAPAASASNLVFADDFQRLDTTVWATCYQWQPVGCTNEWNHELEAYFPDKAHTRNGVLELTASREQRTGYLADSTPQQFQYASGMIRQRQPWMYGYVEAVAQTPAGRGLWPAFWLLPATYQWPPEVDVMEQLGHEPNTVRQAAHSVTGKVEGSVTSRTPYTAGMHRYGVDWQPGRLTWYVDGRQVMTTTTHVPGEPMYLLANLAVGGDWPGAPDTATRFPASYRIDSIKVWRQRP